MRTRAAITLACLLTGGVLALALPPWGWWPLSFVGIVALDRLIADVTWAVRAGRGLLVGIGLYVPSLLWMLDLTAPGYVVACLAYALLLAVGVSITPPTAPGRWTGLVGAIALVELLRWSWPFGGVPLSSLAVAQTAGPLAPVLRVGGALLLVEVTILVAVVLAALLVRSWAFAGLAGAVAAALLAFGVVAPDGNHAGVVEVALVQGGGPQGTRAIDTDEREVFERHLEATSAVRGSVDLVVWPEDVVDVEGPVTERPEGAELQALAQRLDAPLVVGVVEGEGPRFRNAAVVFDSRGDIVDRYEKVHRVPFGEYVPLRSLIEEFAPDSLPDRDAIAGTGPAHLDIPLPAGKTVLGGGNNLRAALAISWEIFFGDRVREGVAEGAAVVLNPTNGSSFTGTLVQTQQVATSRMRAIETGRWVLQVAPTGFSAFVDHQGDVVRRSDISERRVLQGRVDVRTGETPYVRWGLAPGVAVALASLFLARTNARRVTPRAAP